MMSYVLGVVNSMYIYKIAVIQLVVFVMDSNRFRSAI